MWPLLFSTQPICQKCSSDFIGTLNPSAICMSCLSHRDVITQRTEEKEEDLEAGVQGKEPFSACNREQLWKKKILMTRTKAKSRARGWHLRIGSGCIFADVQGGGYCYCCGQILLSPVHAWWMNHLAIGQANSHCRCNKQKSSLPHCSLHITQTIRVEEKKKKKEGGTESPPSYPSAYSCKKNNLKMPCTRITNIMTWWWDLSWNHLETPGCRICCFVCSLIRQHVCSEKHHKAHVSVHAEHARVHLTILPPFPAPVPRKKKPQKKNKAVKHPPGSA